MTAVGLSCLLRFDADGVSLEIEQLDLRTEQTRVRSLRVNILELPGDRFVIASKATSLQWREAAEVAHKRLPRCSPGSERSWAYRAIIAKAERESRRSLCLVPGGAS